MKQPQDAVPSRTKTTSVRRRPDFDGRMRRIVFSAPEIPAEPATAAEKKRYRFFSRPVVVQTGRLDRDRVVTNARHAAIVLLHEWPDRRSPKRRAAMQRCMEVITGKKPPSAARKAFVAAAREAGVLLEG